MNYVIRRRQDDLYLTVDGNWKEILDQNCWLTKEQMNNFKNNNFQNLNNFLIYTVINPT